MTQPITNTRTIEVVTLNRKGVIGARWLSQHNGYSRQQRRAAECFAASQAPTVRSPEVAPVQFTAVVPEPCSAAVAASDVAPDLTSQWDVETAKVAFRLLGESGQSKTAFAKEHGFSRSRFNTWESRVS